MNRFSLKNIPLNRLVITASTLAILGSGICISTLLWAQKQILKRPYCKLALDKMKSNEAVIEFVGKPIHLKSPDLIDKSNKIESDRCDLWIPFVGSKKQGQIRVVAQKLSDFDGRNESDAWKIKRLEMKIKDLPDRLMIVYKESQFNE
ncbi:transmembrane and TPR repeat-containing protein 1 [Sarcoptes scabiei]|nr:transmembrane and TPR repeat-containing protein 1 [Sarcoptes scabiei]